MSIPRLFKLPVYKKFTYRPLYHDPIKEAREARLRDIEAESGIKTDTAYTSRIQRGTMRSYFKSNATSKKQSNVRLILIIVFLLFVSYLLLFR
jgi:hypothetical protein